ncbi:hydroxymethylbilane synthase [Snodgrassella gandavensis]|uniref:hydroxymethylbilane synthase n=1 Tax=Snodgrassella gandavensis TaxID=2946698 RepID=UPI001EF5C352|nr:hydroxymethylbilane synthase [Snodgrassella gandavensis]
MTNKNLVIASRESALAMWQARYVQQCLQTVYPDLSVDIRGMTTRGDQILHQSLSKIGGKGLFIKELELALQQETADIAVHSLKDVPMQLPEGFVLAAITKRTNPLDAFVSHQYASLADLPAAAIVGTSSLRREAQIRLRYPHLQVKPLRGNVQTRLDKLDRQEYAAIILAAAGLKRLGLDERIRNILPADLLLPAVGQGALAIEVAAHRQDLLTLLQALHHPVTAACVTAERSMAKVLGGSCQVPLAAYCTEKFGMLELRGLVASVDGKTVLRASAQASMEEAELLGLKVAQQLAQQGAQQLINAVLSAR